MNTATKLLRILKRHISRILLLQAYGHLERAHQATMRQLAPPTLTMQPIAKATYAWSGQ